ncbi:pilus assembly protein [Chelatococcus sambhunathii]|uniref:Pilus assembly protein n=1 Tax=Chelatococcus sambhunathii TaxID=363953 RepID=A0ABU1DET2_9HYPH|nr:TadE/TadG family type IV pilus assembly protein [Chelatococcus sambhunathii]MDR4306631.1 pilus assembly protein [Chelatococcus sambhunathii]
MRKPFGLKRFSRAASGATIVEFALIAPVLMLMIVGLVELGLLLTARTILDNATFSAARVGKTGYSTATRSQSQLILDAVRKGSSGFLDPAKIALTSKAYTDYGNIGQPEPFTDTNKNGVRDAGEAFTDVNGNGSYDKDQGAAGPGASAQIVVYEASYDWNLFTPFVKRFIGTNGVVKLTSRIVVKNEPY